MTEFDITRNIPLIAEPGDRGGRNCPDQSELVAYARAEIGAAERSRLEAHLADCSFCLGQVGFLVREAPEELPAVPVWLLEAARGVKIRWFDQLPKPALTALASAAVLVLAVAVGLQLRVLPGSLENGRSAPPPVLESTAGVPIEGPVRNGHTALPAPQILHPREGEIVADSGGLVLWKSSPGALEYTVWLVNLEGDVVWEGRSSGPSVVIPPTTKLEPGQKYFVWVEAHLETGGSVKSAAVGFRVAARE